MAVEIPLRFETRRLLLRAYQPSDAEEVRRVASRPEIYATTAYIPKDYPSSRASWWISMVNTTIRNRSGYELGIFSRRTGRYLGSVGLVNVRREMKSASVAYHIDPEFWGRGIATEACARMVRFGFSRLGLYRIAGACMAVNPGSRRVMEHLGFTFEGVARAELRKDGKFFDIEHFSLLRGEWDPRRGTTQNEGEDVG